MKPGITRPKALEAILVIAMGLLVIHLITRNPVFLYAALGSGLTGIFIKPLAGWIAAGWYKAGEWMGMVVSKVLLALVFFILLVPIALLYRLFNKDPLRLKRPESSNWTTRDHLYTDKDLKNIW